MSRTTQANAACERRGGVKGLVGRRARELDAKLLDDLYVYVTLLRVLQYWHGAACACGFTWLTSMSAAREASAATALPPAGA
jgi:hypothetical protein